jgi:hypothetical protein
MKFINEMEREMGVRVVMYGAWVSPDEQLKFTQYVILTPIMLPIYIDNDGQA